MSDLDLRLEDGDFKPYFHAMCELGEINLKCLSEATSCPGPIPWSQPMICSICATPLPSSVDFDVEPAKLKLSVSWKTTLCEHFSELRVIAEALTKSALEDVKIDLRSRTAKSRRQAALLLALSSLECRLERFELDLLNAIEHRNRTRPTGDADYFYAEDLGCYAIEYKDSGIIAIDTNGV